MKFGVARIACAGLALSAVGMVALGAPSADGQANFVQDGKAGFVVAEFAYALAEQPTRGTDACPDGMAAGPGSLNAGFAPPLPQQIDATQANQYRAAELFGDAIGNPNVRNLCMDPAGVADPNFRTVVGRDVAVLGIDLDGRDSSGRGQESCAHDDFRGVNGERGIDNQFFRAVGCTNSFQPGGQSNIFSTEMRTGSWGILLTLSGVDDVRNDDEVEVGFYVNNDPIQLSPSREPLANATYAAERNPRFRAVARGRIANGVLTTDPVDVRFRNVRAGMLTERPLRDARLRATLGADGVMEGYLAGYTPVEDMYNVQFGLREGTDAEGRLAPLAVRTYISIGAANALGYTCQGVYAALVAHADGHPDPATSRCTSISTQYRFRAIPAFVIDSADASMPQR